MFILITGAVTQLLTHTIPLSHTHTIPLSHTPNLSLFTKHRSGNTATDCHNPEFDEWLRTRAVHRFNRLEEQREIRRQGKC